MRRAYEVDPAQTPNEADAKGVPCMLGRWPKAYITDRQLHWPDGTVDKITVTANSLTLTRDGESTTATLKTEVELAVDRQETGLSANEEELTECAVNLKTAEGEQTGVEVRMSERMVGTQRPQPRKTTTHTCTHTRARARAHSLSITQYHAHAHTHNTASVE